jgi:murein DD-endopeptidase MepM/ murein hydrolase activator NlpD
VTETKYDENGNPYTWTVLQTTLTVGRMGDTISASLTPGEQTERYAVYMQTCGNRQAYSNPFDFPWLGYVSSGYGWRVHPITGAKDLHRGVDIAAAQGTAIKAIQDGRVVSAGDMGSCGLCVVIEDGKGYQSRYAHCSSLNVSAGQEVQRGDVIGAVGSTGDSTGPHLHLEVMLNGEYLNPYYFVDTGGSGEAIGPTIPSYSGEPVDGGTFDAMIAEAEKYLGYPYVWGGASPSTSFDCSGFVSWVINHSGWNYGRLGVIGLEDVCTPVSLADAQPGDLVFFIGTYDAPNPNRPSHVGIYAGNGRFIHCGDPISYADLSEPYWVNHFYGFGRLPAP